MPTAAVKPDARKRAAGSWPRLALAALLLSAGLSLGAAGAQADTTKPMLSSITHQTPSGSPTNADEVTWRVTFDEDVRYVTAGDFSIAGTTASLTVTAVTGDAKAWDVKASGGNLASLDATITLSFASGQDIEDLSGNTLDTPADTGKWTIDNTPPGVSIDTPAVISNYTYLATYTFDEPVTGLTVHDTRRNGVSVMSAPMEVTGNGIEDDTTWQFYVVRNFNNHSGRYRLGMQNNGVTDRAGNTGPAENVDVRGLVDREYPSLQITGVPGMTTSPFTATFTFSEPVEGFTQSDIGATNMTVSDFTNTVAQRVWTAKGTPNGEGNYRINVGVGAATDLPGNRSGAVNVEGIYGGMVTSRSRLSLFERGDDASFTVALDRNLTGNVTVTVSSGDTGAATVSPSSLTFTQSNWSTPQTVTVTPVSDAGDSDRSTTVTLSASGGGYGAAPVATVSLSIVDLGFRVSSTSLSLTEGGAAATLPVSLSAQPPGNVTVQVEADDEIGVGGGDSAVSLLPRTLTFTRSNWSRAQLVRVSAVDDADREDESLNVRLSVSGGLVRSATVAVCVDDDADGDATCGSDDPGDDPGDKRPDPNDSTPPTLDSLARHLPAGSPTNADAVTWRLTFSEAVANVTADDFTTTGTTTSRRVSAVAGDAAKWDVTLSGGNLANLDGAVTLAFASGQDIEDLSGNALATPSDTGRYMLDNTKPADPMAAHHALGESRTNADAVTWRIDFGEAVSGVGAGDFTLAGTTASLSVAAVAAGDASMRDVTASGGDLAGLSGTITLSLAGTQDITDLAGNALTGRLGGDRTYVLGNPGNPGDPNNPGNPDDPGDGQGLVPVTGTDDDAPGGADAPPILTAITQQTSAQSPTNATTLTWGVQFSTAVQRVDAADFTVTGTTARLTVTGAGATWAVTAAGGDLAQVEGPVTLSVAVTQDIESLAGLAFTPAPPTGRHEATYVLDRTAPTLTITGVPAHATTGFTATFTFDEPVEGFDATDLTVTQGTPSAWTVVTPGRQYTVQVTPRGDYRLTVRAGAATDAAGNGTAVTTAQGQYQVGLVIEPGTLTVPEGGTASYTIRLLSAPTGAVTVRVTSDTPAVATVSGAGAAPSGGVTLHFAPSSWATARTVTVRGLADADAENGKARLEHAATGTPEYAGVTATLPVTVEDAEGAALGRVTRQVLPNVARLLADQTVLTIAQRVTQRDVAPASAFHVGGMPQGTGAAPDEEPRGPLAPPSVNLKQIIGGSSFLLRLNDGAGAWPLTLWGTGNYRRMSGALDGVTWAGDLVGAHVGLDTPVGGTGLLGLAVGVQESVVTFRAPGEVALLGPGDGTQTTHLVNVAPYVRWRDPEDAWELWGTAGYGLGRVNVEQGAVALKSTVTTQTLAAGGAGRLWGAAEAQVQAKGQVVQTWLATSGRAELRTGRLGANVIRVGLEGSLQRAVAESGALETRLEAGLRHDSGDGLTGTGAEVGGGLLYRDRAWGLTAESRGRMLLGHSGGTEDWGVSGRVQLDPGDVGTGWGLTVAPTWGQVASRASALWTSDSVTQVQGVTGLGDREAGHLAVAFGYGWRGAQFGIRPYGRLDLGWGQQRYAVGSVWDQAGRLQVNLEGSREEQPLAAVNHGVAVRLNLRW